jgi:hypothetical protein
MRIVPRGTAQDYGIATNKQATDSSSTSTRCSRSCGPVLVRQQYRTSSALYTDAGSSPAPGRSPRGRFRARAAPRR